jgi:hypothetical protein
MLARPTGNAAIRLRSEKKSGRASGKSSNENPVEGKWNLGYKCKKETGIFGTRKSYQESWKGRDLEEKNDEKPESDNSLESGLREKKRPSQKAGFFCR